MLFISSRPESATLTLLQERINFAPHPKTITMAGDYEYAGWWPLLVIRDSPVAI